MKATFLAGRVDHCGKHNDRNFDISSANHIDSERVHLNQYWTYNNSGQTFEQSELEFYTKYFYNHVSEQNQRNTEARHPERNQTIESYYKNVRTQPEDIILQIGNRENSVDADSLWECALEYQKQFEQAYGKNCKILNMALHNDEETPHVHIRRVWIAEDDYGNLKVSQKMALQNMGFVRPDLDRRENNYNNPKISFTKCERKLFEEICREKGIDIQVDNREKREHLTISEFKKKKLKEETEQLEQTLIRLQRETKMYQENQKHLENFADDIYKMFCDSDYYAQLYRDELLNIQKIQEKKKRDKEIFELFRKSTKYFGEPDIDYKMAIAKAEVDHKSIYRHLEDFIEQKGLDSEYRSYLRDIQNKKTLHTEEHESTKHRSRVRPLV